MASLFALILSIITLITGIIWLVDKFFLAPIRRKKATELNLTPKDEAYVAITQQPWLIELGASIFPIIAVVLILRSFIYEPFQIPSGSMKPTLLVGDFILVEKFAYGLKDPVFNKTLVSTGQPKRGDIIVFKYPKNPSVDFIKRLVGLPGDRIYYDVRKKQICIQPKGASQCELVKQTDEKVSDIIQEGIGRKLVDVTEQLGDVSHHILKSTVSRDDVNRYVGQQNNQYWEVPQGEYFMMGDNRDESSDGRFWGFVPEKNLVGKAVAIWISFEFERSTDSFWHWLPTDVRFNRIGGIK